MVMQDLIFYGAYKFTSKSKEGVEKKWVHLTFKLPEQKNSVGESYQSFIMADNGFDLNSYADKVGKSCLVDYAKNFCNQIIFV